MKRSTTTVPWKEGLHLRPATQLVKRSMAFKSSISLRVNERLADARNILAIMLLCASFGAVVDIEASGADEADALEAITAVFDLEETGEVRG